MKLSELYCNADITWTLVSKAADGVKRWSLPYNSKMYTWPTAENDIDHKRQCVIFVITKTYLYDFDPLKPHFYIVKLGFTGVYIIFLISAQNIDCWYSLEPPHWGSSNEYQRSIFWAEIWKISEFFYLKIFIFCGDIFRIFEWAFFRNVFTVLRIFSVLSHKLNLRFTHYSCDTCC